MKRFPKSKTAHLFKVFLCFFACFFILSSIILQNHRLSQKNAAILLSLFLSLVSYSFHNYAIINKKVNSKYEVIGSEK